MEPKCSDTFSSSPKAHIEVAERWHDISSLPVLSQKSLHHRVATVCISMALFPWRDHVWQQYCLLNMKGGILELRPCILKPPFSYLAIFIAFGHSPAREFLTCFYYFTTFLAETLQILAHQCGSSNGAASHWFGYWESYSVWLGWCSLCSLGDPVIGELLPTTGSLLWHGL